ncbi:hypothetical protein SALBM311S_05784 [Streptomyces alboniger]
MSGSPPTSAAPEGTCGGGETLPRLDGGPGQTRPSAAAGRGSPGEEGRQRLDGAGERRPYGMAGRVPGPGPARRAGGTVVRVLRGYDAVGALGAVLIPCALEVAAAPLRHLPVDRGCRRRAAGCPLPFLCLCLCLCLFLCLFPVPRVRAHHQRAEQHTQHAQEQREERPRALRCSVRLFITRRCYAVPVAVLGDLANAHDRLRRCGPWATDSCGTVWCPSASSLTGARWPGPGEGRPRSYGRLRQVDNAVRGRARTQTRRG